MRTFDPTLITFVIYIMAMILIGFFAWLYTKSFSDYILGGRSLGSLVTGLSAGASDMSGWLLMGLPGAIFVAGLSESWIAIGLTIGAYLNWLFVAGRLRLHTEYSGNALTLPDYFTNRFEDKSRLLRILSALVILVFFTIYCASGIVAGARLFESTFGLSYANALWVGAVATVLYVFVGGFLAVSWTDTVQAAMMLFALLVTPVFVILSLGNVSAAMDAIAAVNPAHFDMFRGLSFVAIISLLGWGLGYFGQPHIVVRFMALRTPQEAKSARRIGTTWQFLSLAGAVLSGLIGIAYFAKFGNAPTDAETVVLLMSQVLLHPLVAGFVLAAVLAAVMSTLSSQLIVCSSALVEDMYRAAKQPAPSERTLVLLGRLCVLAITVIAGLLAVHPNDSILGLVAFAWAGFGAAFGPLVLLSLYWRKLTNVGAIGGMIAGAAMVFVWKSLHTGLYELLPAFTVGMAVMWLVSLLTYQRNDEIEQEFTQAVQAAGDKA